MKGEAKTIAKNRKALHEYEIVETLEAGIELTGTEVRSLRENNCQLTDCFALIRICVRSSFSNGATAKPFSSVKLSALVLTV